MKRHINILYGIEVLSGRLNLSSPDVEKRKSENDNVSYVKKIDNRGYVSAPCSKKAILQYMKEIGDQKISVRKKVGSKVTSPAHPSAYVNEDIFGFMSLENVTISKEEYESLSSEEKIGFKTNKKGYSRNISKKRKARFMLSPLINISNRKINSEYNICTTDGDSMPYQTETYSGIMVGYGNMNIDDISKFTISDNEKEFRDYSTEEGLTEKDIELTREERLERIKLALKGLEYLEIQGNRTNHLTDTSIKIVILGEYSWGNNLFQGVITKEGLNIEALKETLEENEEFRLSPIWIGFSKRLKDDIVKESFEKAKDELRELDFIKVDSVKNAFDGYLEYLNNNYKSMI